VEAKLAVPRSGDAAYSDGPTSAAHMCAPRREPVGTSDLKEQLEQAVREERYEDAARLRDLIKAQGVSPPAQTFVSEGGGGGGLGGGGDQRHREGATTQPDDASPPEHAFSRFPLLAESMGNDPHSGLPPDWEAVCEYGSEHVYYWNRLTNETTWQKPVEACVCVCVVDVPLASRKRTCHTGTPEPEPNPNPVP
jgi:hypothetical protein